MTASFNLQPDITNPLMVLNPLTTSTGAVFTVKFSFPSATPNAIGPSAYGSSGLTLGQFIGIVFPPSVGTTDLTLDQGSNKYLCSLTEGTSTSIEVSAVPSSASSVNTQNVAENNIAYCRLDDLNYAYPLKVGPGTVYTLKITLNTVKIASTNYLRSLTLFTSTSNNQDKIIIDSIPVLGTAALYADYTLFTPKALDLVTPLISVTQGPTTAIGGSIVYPYNQFDVTFNLKATTFISAADHLFVITYPANMISAPTSIINNQAASNDPLQAAVKGNLSIASFGSNGIAINGITEDLIPGRTFQIVLKGWKALDNVIGGTPGLLSVIVYYKNTYSVLSYVSSGIFTVTQDSMTLKANHPEFWDVYRSGAWPITFSLKTTNDLTAGGWVVIQHSNNSDVTTTTGNKVTFIPSTCDFSKNDSFYNSF